MKGYRESIKINTVVAEQSDVDNETDFLLPDDVTSIITEIESRVNEIKDMLDKITGLTEVDEIKELVKDLSHDLY